jgi:hypothetical protein
MWQLRASSYSVLIRLAAFAAAAAILALPGGSAFATTTGCSGSVVLAVVNPIAGAVVPSGNLIMNGDAYDLASSSGPGVDSVQFFLGPRETGGALLANATLGQANATPAPAAASGFAANVGLTRIGTFSIYGYAHGVSGHEAVVAIPVSIQSSTTTTQPTPPPPCQPGQAAAPAAPTPGAPSSAQGPAKAATLQLRLDNPAAGATLPLGNMLLEGTARDLAASSGSGVDRVQAFLGDQNTGGEFLGGATPNDAGNFVINISLGSGDQGAQTLYVYAHSSVTNQQRLVTRAVVVVST